MIYLLHHPTPIQLDLLLGTGAQGEVRGISAHVARCVRCQNELRSLRLLRTIARGLPAPPMPVGLFSGVERRLAAGDRVLLPVHETPVTPKALPWRRLLSLAAAIGFVIVVATHPGRRLEAAGTAGDLTVVSGAPASPNVLTVRYRPALALASADSVVLHAKLFATGRRFAPTERTSVLRQRTGVFVGELQLPPEAVLATFTVASSDGQHIDDNDARTWEYASRDSANRPTFEGLRMQNVIHERDDWERSFAAAKEMVRLYPDRPEGLALLIEGSQELTGASKADSVAGVFRSRVEALDSRYGNRPADAELMWQMVKLGNLVRDTAIARSWFDRMKREYPRDAGTIQLRVFSVFDEAIPDTARLRRLDALWEETGGNSPQLVVNAFQLADKLGDEKAVERWGGRVAAVSGGAASTATTYVRYGGLRPQGEIALRAALATFPPFSADWQVAMRSGVSARFARGQWQLATLGGALLRDGKPEAALDTLRRAAAIAWDPGTLALLGDAALAAHDTGEAIRAYAWVIADPRTSPARGDSLRARLVTAAARPIFTAAVAEGRSLVRARALASAYRHSFDPAATYADSGGERHALRDALGPGLSVLAVVSRNCAPSIADAPSLDRLKGRLASLGIPVIVLVEEAPNGAASSSLTALGFSGAVGFDDRAEVSHALRQFGTPQYFVIEGGTTVRSDQRKAMDVVGIVDALVSK